MVPSSSSNSPATRFITRLVLVGAMTALGACVNAPAAHPPIDVAAIVADPARTDEDHKADAGRKPAEFLRFAQIEPGMRALDVDAGGGYTSELLALASGTGTVWAQAERVSANLAKRLAAHPQPNLIVVTLPFQNPVPAEATGLDRITIVLNYHDITYAPVDRAVMNKHLFDALKPGGKLIVIDHAARSGSGTTDGKTLHRVDPATVREEMLQAGFRFDASADFLANPADPHTQAFFDMQIPSDKFALRFVKP